MAPPDWVVELLSHAELVPVEAQPLTGGVSSDVWRVRLSSGESVVVKRAIERLRVQAHWVAPLERNTFEARYLMRAAAIVPSFTPRVVMAVDNLHAFAMTDLGPIPSWREDLANGRIDPEVGGELGAHLVAVHAHTAGDDTAAREFASNELFEALRIEPYLRYPAEHLPEHADALSQLADDLAGTHIALVHGDVSPKNVIVTADGPVLTDAECAWYGDPAFDLAFCLNHLLLKRIWKPEYRELLWETSRRLCTAYLAGVSWEPPDAVAARTARLLPALALARVDGRSPVDYLSASQRDSLRTRAGQALHESATDPLAVAQQLEGP
ncbi:aminoglycoside phosphotransferase [Mycolicibacterium phlei]|uniref:phosphotransferase n=1 Tax=Mycobacteroides chelonae TaxID=1774 RepID=UPI000618BF19|nr:aminoglycoside phosphotransferase family protein [Mycobacteroides chelonae]VEG14446.1 aminoglycoside phosphotransferase [Mycolicibacterium phlei]AKC37495.1 aminoglycoside phosphotransferase [Mycobacteroides chelonae]ANA96551.1 aminoglycoside phosphotransferase [Mycobacteroides chelonae CCUG 47445]OLT81315.1 aminoglycoside phosphotransferase [Mycobacteroides chelonae]ORV17345.1 aminoglycoside phosphotransferase [Mycobacteroides chelonae]